MEQLNISSHKRKTNGYNSTVLHATRDAKRREAQARQRDHDKLTVAQKIAKAEKRDGDSKREITRLKALLKPVSKPATETPAPVEKAVKKAKKLVKYGQDLAKTNKA